VYRFGDAIHAVDVRLVQLTAVRVDRQPATDLDRTVGDEILGLALPAETQLLQLDQRERREVVRQNRGLSIGRLQPRLLLQLQTDQTHFGQTQLRPVVADDRILVRARPLRRGLDERRSLLEIAGSLRRRDDNRHRAIGFLAAVQQPQRFGDPPRILVILNGDRLLIEVSLRVLRRVLGSATETAPKSLLVARTDACSTARSSPPAPQISTSRADTRTNCPHSTNPRSPPTASAPARSASRSVR